VEIHPLAVALNQANGEQRNKTLSILFESRIMETELNREKKWSIIFIISSLVTGLFSTVPLIFNQQVSPTIPLLVSL